MSYRITLQDAFKNYTLDQDKSLSPKETVQRFRKKLKSVDLDILERTERIDNGRLGIPVFFSQCGKDARNVIGTKKQMGKGGTTQQAEASAVMELAERFSFFSFCKNPQNFITGTPADMKNNAPLTFNNTGFSVQINPDIVYSIGISVAFAQPTVYIQTVSAKGEVSFPGVANFSSIVGVPIYCAVATAMANGTLGEFTDPVKLR